MQPDARISREVVAQIPPAVIRERVVLVASGKGGVGTSVATSLLALAYADAGKRVLVIDGHEGNGALHHLFGVRPLRSLDALRDHTVEVSDVVIDLSEHFSLVTTKPASDEQLSLSPEDRRVPFERLLPLSADYDCVIVDGGSRLDNVLAIAESGAGVAVLVTDADRISLAANYALLKVLAQRASGVRCSVLVSRHDDLVSRGAGDQLVDACERFLNLDLSLVGSIPDDACLRAAIGAGMPIGDAADGSPAALVMQAIAQRVLPWLSPARADARASSSPLRQRS